MERSDYPNNAAVGLDPIGAARSHFVSYFRCHENAGKFCGHWLSRAFFLPHWHAVEPEYELRGDVAYWPRHFNAVVTVKHFLQRDGEFKFSERRTEAEMSTGGICSVSSVLNRMASSRTSRHSLCLNTDQKPTPSSRTVQWTGSSRRIYLNNS